MPNLDSIRRTTERRAARAQTKQDATQAAEDQEQALAELQNRVQRQQAGEATQDDIDIIETLRQRAETNAKPMRVSRAQRKVEQQAAATAQAEIDVQRTVAPLDEQAIDLSHYRKLGIDPPLHVLNRLAQQADKVNREMNRDAASAAGKAVFDVLNEKRPEASRETRQKHIAEAKRSRANARTPAAATAPAKIE